VVRCGERIVRAAAADGQAWPDPHAWPGASFRRRDDSAARAVASRL